LGLLLLFTRPSHISFGPSGTPGAPGWSDKQQVEVTGKEGAPLALTLEMVRQLIDVAGKEEDLL